MCSSMTRRFVHLIVDDLKAGAGGYSLRNIDVQPLFAAGATAGVRTTMRSTRPPRPVTSLEFARRHSHIMEFFLLGSRIVGLNNIRHTVMYDTSTNAFRAGPDLRHGKFTKPAWAAVRGRLYLADSVPAGLGAPYCFESLRFDGDGALQDRVWDPLPSPPFPDDTPRGSGSSIIHSYASGDGGTIWLSTLRGTYTFDADTATWRKEGDWTLPFDGRAQYVPDLGLYFGFTKGSSRLCSAELVVGAKASEPPAHRHVWYGVGGYTGMLDHEWPDVDLDAYGAGGDGWRLARSDLTCLGGGKFCVTRFYDTTHQSDDFGFSCNVAVITAVEARLDPSTGDVQMISGASRCYKFSDDTLHGWAL